MEQFSEQSFNFAAFIQTKQWFTTKCVGIVNLTTYMRVPPLWINISAMSLCPSSQAMHSAIFPRCRSYVCVRACTISIHVDTQLVYHLF